MGFETPASDDALARIRATEADGWDADESEKLRGKKPSRAYPRGLRDAIERDG